MFRVNKAKELRYLNEKDLVFGIIEKNTLFFNLCMPFFITRFVYRSANLMGFVLIYAMLVMFLFICRRYLTLKYFESSIYTKLKKKSEIIQLGRTK